MERQGVDLQTRIEELQIKNHLLRDNNKVKEDDALAHLSDQLLVLSERIQQLERKQTNYQFSDWDSNPATIFVGLYYLI